MLPTNETLRSGSRWRSWAAAQTTHLDLLWLVGLGAAAALAASWDLGLRLPGHAILRVIFPLTVGLAVVPRNGAGVVMSAAAAATLLGLRWTGWQAGGAGALTSLLLTGPLLDLSARWARDGRQLYLSFAAAGLLSNLAAFVVRGATKMASGGHGGGMGGGRGLSEWWLPASVSYLACGVLAGLVSAVLCFRATPRKRPPLEPGA